MISLIRTANAGCLLQMDGVQILLDGVCREVPPFLPTPPSAIAYLEEHLPDAVAFTHLHADHYDASFVQYYCFKKEREVLLPGHSLVQVGSVKITPVPSRHIGKVDCAHVSYILEGIQCCVWFLGDASPLQWKDQTDLPKPDIVIAPFAYATTQTAWRQLQLLQPRAVILMHLPDRCTDPDGLWDMVEKIINSNKDFPVIIPQIMEKISVPLQSL